MKVDNSIKKLGDISVGDPRLCPQHESGKARKNEAPSDSVQLSAASLKLQTLFDRSGQSIFDSKKVEEIKLAIAEGRFQVNPGKIADGLLAEVRDLLQSRKR